MMRIIRWLGSVRLALMGMGLLAVGAMLSYGNPDSTPIWVLLVPLALLSINLLIAILTNARIQRRPPLLIFHVGLLAIVILAAVGRLTFFEGRVEVVEGSPFSEQEVFDTKQGMLHFGRLSNVRFVQGGYTVEYFPNLTRGRTRSQVTVPDAEGKLRPQTVGDDTPLVIDGYRFYTTFNKGFAPLVTWTPKAGEPLTGAIHMPSYPLFEHKQDNTWTPPGANEFHFWLRLETGLDATQSWILDGQRSVGVLVVNDGEWRVELKPGEEVALTSGTLRYERLLTWMGYKIFYDPTLKPLFVAAILSVLGLFWHFWRKFGSEFEPVSRVASPSMSTRRA
jgi:cytochrome c biogenesis protein